MFVPFCFCSFLFGVCVCLFFGGVPFLSVLGKTPLQIRPFYQYYGTFTDFSSLSCAILIGSRVANYTCIKALLGFLPVSPHLGSPNNVFMLVSFTALPLSGSTQKHIIPRHWTSSKLPSVLHLGISLSGLGRLECSKYRRWQSVKRASKTKRNNYTWCSYFKWAELSTRIDRVIIMWKEHLGTQAGVHLTQVSLTVFLVFRTDQFSSQSGKISIVYGRLIRLR